MRNMFPSALLFFLISYPQKQSHALVSRSLAQTNFSVGTCGVSSLGYQCYLQVCSSIALHWSLGGPPPSLMNCQYSSSSSTATSGALNSTADVIHFALTTDLTGYVAMSLPAVVQVMSPADSIIALITQANSSGSVGPYLLQGISAQSDSTYQLSNTAVMSDINGITACFSRPVSAVGKAGRLLSLASSPVGMNFAAAPAGTPALHQHAMDSGHLCGGYVQLLASAVAGGQYSMAAVANPHTAIVAHGLLMMAAWLVLLPIGGGTISNLAVRLVLLPIGVLAARHRWLFPKRSSPSSGGTSSAAKVDMWFNVHRILQLSGVTLFSIGLILPWTAFGQGSSGGNSSLLESHGAVGIIIAVLTYSQTVLAFVRPKPDATYRQWWNLQHWFTGRAAVLLAIINLIIGVQVFHQKWLEPRGLYFAAIFILLGIIVGGAIFLEVKRFKKGGSWQQLPLQDVSVQISSDTLTMETGGSDRKYAIADEDRRSMLPSGTPISA
ncbi:hypothetical protein CEUSTIGMA_g10512.t1 [Chlamydomonas eustigma]|uniref:Cytochrome b561 domain-containing protein n=1 Tax=Chlamydomonas eustigma TaxID=1157962 RepID=A0A250XJ88_9CHLO|nr:hypothetical protein CEUSTIGMA_g10512.t1 [Chlamydomonas eustigma]|eukprot:GAX83086.1 hypothetical protein CEUSTIGMA_g10512.t1 [Chlamydomonas eustigma]